MEDGERFDIRHSRQSNAFLPSGMAPADLGWKFIFRVGRIIDHQIGAIDQVENIFIRLARDMLGIGYVADRLALEFDAVSGRAIGVVEHGGPYADIFAELESFAGVEIAEFQFRFQRLYRHRKHGFGHLPRYHLKEAALLFQMPGHEREFMIGMKSGRKEGKARDVVSMGVGEHQGRFGEALFEIPMTEIADTGSGIEDDLLAAGIHFQATRIAAEGDVVRRRAGDAAAYTPKFEFKTH